jgi:drug/metabolite transporter (DMT)-like permease
MESRETLTGVAFVAIAMLIFAVSDTIGKHLFALYSVLAVAAVRYIVNLVLLFAVLWPSHRNNLWRTQKTGLVILRGLCLVLATLTMSYALQLMPVGETVAILYLYPFLVMLLAAPLLGEKVSNVMWVGAVASFAGVLLIVRPGGGLDPVGVVLMLLNVFLATAYALMTRHLARTETTIAMLFHSALSGTIIFTGLAFAMLDSFAPTMKDFALMLLIGLLATAGHFLITAAYRHAPASYLAPINYLHLVFAGLLGIVVFNHVPDTFAAVGMVLIAASGMVVALLAGRAKAMQQA